MTHKYTTSNTNGLTRFTIERKLYAYHSPRLATKFKVRKLSNDQHVRRMLVQKQLGKCPGLTTIHGRIFRSCMSYRLECCDHIIERRYRGADKIYNLQMLCNLCHKVKNKWNRVSQTLL